MLYFNLKRALPDGVWLVQDLVQQIARQRDMFRRLLQDAASVSGRSGAAGDLQLIASADAQLAGNSALQVPRHDMSPTAGFVAVDTLNLWQTAHVFALHSSACLQVLAIFT